MNHPFGDLLHQHLHRRHGLTQSKLAAGILQDPAVISNMSRGRRLTGKQARERVVDIIRWLHEQEVLTNQDEANAMLRAAGLISLQQDVAAEADLLAALSAAVVPISEPPVSRTPTNLPAQLTSFVGRESATLAVSDLLARRRLVTLTGVGGIGKTRLAIESGISLLEEGAPVTFSGGIWLAPLASLNEPSLLAESVVRSLTPIQGVSGSALETLVEYLADKELLLILDNCEHLIDACAALVETLLQRCWHLRLLATSREALRIPGERVFAVEPLSFTIGGRADDGVPAAALRLFMDRARVLSPGVSFDQSDLETVDHICRRLDGIPLALELAASRVSQVSLDAIAGQLDRQMNLLSSLYRTAIPRHHTMQAALAWSYSLLTTDAQHLLIRLSVFARGWLLDGAQAIKPDLDSEQVSSLLFELVEKSLAVAETVDGDWRFRLLEPVRQFALLQLRQAGEEERARRHLADYFMGLAEQVDRARDTEDETVWLQRMQQEVDNLRAVNRWALAHKEAEFAQRLNGHLHIYHCYGGDLAEANHWFGAALSLTSDLGDQAAAKARVHALFTGGACAGMYCNYDQALAYYEEAATLFHQLANLTGVSAALQGCAVVKLETGDLDAARPLVERGMQFALESGDPVRIAWDRFGFARLLYAEGAYTHAAAHFQAVVEEHRAVGIPSGVFRALIHLGNLQRLLGAPAFAYLNYREALTMPSASTLRTYVADAFEGLAGLAAEDGLAKRGVVLLSAGHATRRSSAYARQNWEIKRYEQDLDLLRGQMDEVAWTAAWTTGETLSVEAAVRFALA